MSICLSICLSLVCSQMSGSPCPGVGIARSLRSLFPASSLMAVDDKEDLMSAMADGVFNSCFAFDDVMRHHQAGSYDDTQRMQWDFALSALVENQEAMYIP